jgi:hypothetical protein
MGRTANEISGLRKAGDHPARAIFFPRNLRAARTRQKRQCAKFLLVPGFVRGKAQHAGIGTVTVVGTLATRVTENSHG